MNKEKRYSKPECQVIEIKGESILCASDSKTGLLNEEWKHDGDYSIF